MCSDGTVSGSLLNSEIDTYPGRTRYVPGSLKKPMHLAIGMFDGVHLGHRRVIDEAVQMGEAPGHESGVLTFDPHPARILRPEAAPPLLMSLAERVDELLGCQLRHVFVHAFTSLFSQAEAEVFVPYLKVLFPGLRSLHVGENFRFGMGRRGDGVLLKASARRAGLEAFVHSPLCLGNESVSSSRIRRLVQGGELASASAMLGRPYGLSGAVVGGRRIGREMGVPTLNLKWESDAHPPFGVYASRCILGGDGDAVPGIANLGVRPSISEADSPVLEIHLLEQPASGWPTTGDKIRVELGEFIREEQRFANRQALQSQIEADIREVVDYFRLRGVSERGQ